MTIKLNTFPSIKAFVEICKEFIPNIEISQGNKTVNAKSIIGLFSLNLLKPMYVAIITRDDGERERFYSKVRAFSI